MEQNSPKYQNIKNYLAAGISARTFTGLIPSENRLAREFGVSRMTARRALEELERDGLVDRIPGKGTFVRQYRHYTRGFFRVRPFRKWAEDLNVALRTEVLEARVSDPSQDPADLLPWRGRTVILRILDYLDDTPVRYAVRRLRADRCAGILRENLKEESIHDILINRLHIPLTKITQSMTAIGLSEEMAPLFGEKPGHPAFHFRRLTYSLDTPITYVEYFMRGEMAFEDTFVPQFDGSDFVRG
ncbi:MAG: GntR family transcriptional regulator [Pseudomonadota bacterium]